MQELVNQYFNGLQTTRVTFKACEGSVLGELIFLTKKEDIDLLIVGQYKDGNGSPDTLPEKLARKAFCSVLIAPETATAKIDKVLVAVDFSDHSLNALDVGSAFAKAAQLDHMHILNTYRVPKGYYKTGKTYEEFADIMLENSKGKLNRLLPRVDLKSVGIRPFFRKHDNVVRGINQFSDEIKADLVVVGARGRSGDIAAILLGSVTEGLVRNLNRPLLAVKEKGAGLNILEALSSE
jgi:nucleotide-binding universal stress UspA family protein